MSGKTLKRSSRFSFVNFTKRTNIYWHAHASNIIWRAVHKSTLHLWKPSKVGNLCLFYSYFNSDCFQEIANLVPPPASICCSTLSSVRAHLYMTEISTTPSSASVPERRSTETFVKTYNHKTYKSRLKKYLLALLHDDHGASAPAL